MLHHHTNKFSVPRDASGSTIVERIPEAFPGFSDSAPLTIYNQWPDYVDNEPIYAYLSQSKTDKLSAFISCVYKTSCAIVYYFNGDPYNADIIASGCLIAPNKIVTARHAIDKFPKEHIHVRFFHYEVSEHATSCHITEETLDVPIIASKFAKNGLDACTLIIDTSRIPIELNSKFKPKYIAADNSSIPAAGQYIMFHFGDGIHQVSVGKLSYPQYGMPLQQAIKLQGGPGASGAGIIWYAQGFDDPTLFGISIYRQITNGNIERRIIPYCEFESNAAAIDRIKNPYHSHCLNTILLNLNPRTPGYEFKVWSDDYYGARAEHPEDPNYDLVLPDKHSNHHVIPIGHLFYLWDYLHELDQPTLVQISRQARVDTLARCQGLQLDLQNDLQHSIDFNTSPVEVLRQQHQLTQYYQAEQDKIIQRRIDVLVTQECNIQYDEFLLLIYALTPGGRQDKTWFAWSYWNLFKGWNSKHRTLDPCHNRSKNKNTTRNEKNKPLSFEINLWGAVQNLFLAIENLRRNSIKVHYVVNSYERDVYMALKKLLSVWNKSTKRVHPYFEHDWNCVGKRYGRNQCILKSA